MFTARDLEGDREIVILAPSWESRLKELRRWGRHGRLVCPECQQPVRVRAGKERRRHFAHWHKADCNYGHDDPQVVRARALLYRWLVGKFGEASVVLERRLEGFGLPRPVDLWVQRESGKESIAYWIFGKSVAPGVRDTLHKAFSSEEGNPLAAVNWLFIYNMLRSDLDDTNTLNLNTTERAFLVASPYNAIAHPFHQAVWGTTGGTLHYLNPADQTMITYRGVTLVHKPAIHTGFPKTHALSEVLISPTNGEPVHPGEYEQLRDFRRRKEEWETEQARKQEEEERRQAEIMERLRRRAEQRRSPRDEAGHRKGKQKQISASSPSVREPSTPVAYPSHSSFSSRSFVQEPATCVHCGEVTNNWWYYDPKMGTCQCRPCRDKGVP